MEHLKAEATLLTTEVYRLYKKSG